ncbi:MAG: methylated-DNA--[protein]-cysteine S-methyltransferase [Clostridiales bacterium]|nr:methylated-DNA--[protein]-cysteine S-methyltransferase [Clostridiales bacterium]
MEYQTQIPSPLGVLTLTCTEDALTGLWMENEKTRPVLPNQVLAPGDSPVFSAAADWLHRYFSGEKTEIGPLPLAPRGTHFQQTVWKILCEIPYGEVTTYGAVAKEAAARLGKKAMSAQAVGQAVGRNPISIIIPCHRVIGSNGSLTGYASGLEKKRFLLELEKADLSPRSLHAAQN